MLRCAVRWCGANPQTDSPYCRSVVVAMSGRPQSRSISFAVVMVARLSLLSLIPAARSCGGTCPASSRTRHSANPIDKYSSAGKRLSCNGSTSVPGMASMVRICG